VFDHRNEACGTTDTDAGLKIRAPVVRHHAVIAPVTKPPPRTDAGAVDQFVRAPRTEPHAETTDLTTHLADAVALNGRRAVTYAKRSKGRSLLLSALMITSEAIAIPLAWWFDRQARALNAKGISIMTGDFHDMGAARSSDAAPKYTKVADRASFRTVRSTLKQLRGDIASPMKRGDFHRVAELTYAAIHSVDAQEKAQQAHFAMTRHVLESLGMVALNGARYQRDSGGESTSLSRSVLKSHALVLRATLLIDKLAQRRHAEGIGMIVNDVPPIPFEAAFEAMTKASSRPAFSAES